jgi:hypothetical protein
LYKRDFIYALSAVDSILNTTLSHILFSVLTDLLTIEREIHPLLPKLTSVKASGGRKTYVPYARTKK